MKLASFVLSAALLLTLGMSRSVSAQASSAATAKGVDTVEVLKASATVQAIDLQTRKVTLLLDNGKKKTFKVDKSVQNLDQVKVGDKLKISFTEEVIVVVGKTKDAPDAGAIGAVSVAPKGAKPGIVAVDTYGISAKIVAVDTVKHKVTLLDPDGKKDTVKLGKNAGSMDQFKVGDTIGMVVTDSLVVDVVK